ncbi:MAG: class I SAM-dependent methyltransferase [Opitutaceae bacterium]|jgi:SAM-dependent methyltransferase
MGNFQYEHLWNSLGGKDGAPAAAVGGDFETVGKLEFALLRELGLQPQWAVVDVGCGSGRLSSQLSRWLSGPYLGTDVLPTLLDHARAVCGRPDWNFVRTDGQVIPWPDESADLACFFSVFTHIPHDETWRYILEARRVLKPGGILVCSFLEFRIRSHWAIFRNDAKDRTPQRIPNQFLSRDALEAFAHNAGLLAARFFDGDKPHIPIDGELAFENGHKVSNMGNLGQSVCVIRKPLVPIPEPT